VAIKTLVCFGFTLLVATAIAVVLGKFPPTSMAYCCQKKKYWLNKRRALVREAPRGFAESLPARFKTAFNFGGTGR
jgi:hypothetical protein